ncbi:MAG: HIRAN domain-containing protein [Nitriliruptoraceae bacterium]
MQQRPITLRTVVRGHAFAARPPDSSGPVEGSAVQLVREVTNPSDPLAVAVWYDDGRHLWRLGYLDRAVAARVAERLDDGVTPAATFDGWLPEPDGRWQRPVVAVDATVFGLAMAGSAGSRSQHGAGVETVSSTSYRPQPSNEMPSMAAERPVRLWGRPPGSRRRPTGAIPGPT